MPLNFNVDRFVGGIALNGARIGSMRMSNNTGNLELDELAFAVAPPVPELVITDELPESRIRIDFTGILQSGDSLDDWSDLDPQPASPLFLPYPELATRRFFRSRSGTSPETGNNP